MNGILFIGRALTDADIQIESDADIRSYIKEGRDFSYIDRIDADKFLSEFRPKFHRGGSAATTAEESALMGIPSLFAGSVGDDERGKEFAKSLADFNVELRLVVNPDYLTGFTALFHSKEGKRYGVYHYGASDIIDAAKIDDTNFKVMYAESYVFSSESSGVVVDRYKKHRSETTAINISGVASTGLASAADRIMHIVLSGSCDILIGNDAEFIKIFEEQDLESCVQKALRNAKLVAVTRGSNRSIVASSGENFRIPVYKNIIFEAGVLGDGDAYAAGLLYGLIHGCNHREMGLLGSYAAFRKLARSINPK